MSAFRSSLFAFRCYPPPPPSPQNIENKGLPKENPGKILHSGHLQAKYWAAKTYGLLRRGGRALEKRGLAVGGSSRDVTKPTTDTTGQERQARRILPYNQSMGQVGSAVKLRKYQMARLFCYSSRNGNQGFVRVVRRFSAASRALNIYCHPERGCVRHSERIRVEGPL